MNTVVSYYPDAQALVHEGWKLLVDHLGIQKATQFVVLLERGKGDSVKEIADYWGNATIENIYHRVRTWRSQA